MSGSKLIEKRQGWSEARVAAVKKVVSQSPEIAKHDTVCIYVTGSFGRLEASEHSDLDLFFIEEIDNDNVRMSDQAKALMFDVLVDQCRNLGFPDFSDDGAYLQIHNLQNMMECLGGRADDYENLFTARQLLLLESLPIHNERLYERVRREITGSYFRDYPDHVEDFRPTFLVNDILRYWKTLCLNYEHSRNNPDTNESSARKSQLKNLKLKFSRMLTCFSLIIPLAKPRESIELDECISLMQQRPLKRLKSVAVATDNIELWNSLSGDYSWFLSTVGQPTEDVLKWIGSDANREEALMRAKVFGDNMYRFLASVAGQETLRYLVI